MFDGEKSLSVKLELTFEKAVLASVEMLPLFVTPIIWLVIVLWYGRIQGDNLKINKAEIIFFGFVGAVAAYINKLSSGSFLENSVPSLVIVVSVLFQVLGLANSKWTRPFVERQVLIAGTGTALCFILSSRYLVLAV